MKNRKNSDMNHCHLHTTLVSLSSNISFCFLLLRLEKMSDDQDECESVEHTHKSIERTDFHSEPVRWFLQARSRLILLLLLLFDATHNRAFIDHIYPTRLPFIDVFQFFSLSYSVIFFVSSDTWVLVMFARSIWAFLLSLFIVS